MSLSPNQQRGRERRRSFSRGRSSISIHEAVNPPVTGFSQHRKDDAEIAAIKNRNVREFYEVYVLTESFMRIDVCVLWRCEHRSTNHYFVLKAPKRDD